MDRWSHQEAAYRNTVDAIEGGSRRICITSPTGGGKGQMLNDMLLWAAERGLPSVLYTDRRLLLEQTAGRLTQAGIEYGLRAAGHEPQLHQRVQLAMVQTEFSRVYQSEKWFRHHAKLVIVDEGHKFTGDTAQTVMNGHLEDGAAVLYYTATPVGMADVCDELIIAGTNSELRRCGALVPAITYAPDEPDMWRLKGQPGDDYSENDLMREFCQKPVFGRVYEWWNRLNPDRKPTVLFGPSVAGSLWFAERFYANGIPTAHIDGDDIWVNGESTASSPEAREEVFRRFKSGDIVVMCNRFVMREGWDCPECAHCVFATSFGAVSSYIQSGGRVLRAHDSLSSVIVQDHGGNWWKHGSLNEDRHWQLGDTNKSIALERRDTLRKKNADPDSFVGQEGEPVMCPNCYRPRRVVIGQDNATCPHCGYRTHRKSRYVRQIDGSLKPMWGDIYREPVRREIPDDERKWAKIYFSFHKSNRTFRQAEGFFYKCHRTMPRRDMKLMPLHEEDFTRKIKDVPRDRLR